MNGIKSFGGPSARIVRYFFMLLSSVTLSIGNIVINEIHYDPEDKTEPLEFIELYNNGTTAVDLTGYHFDDGIDYTFVSGSSIAAGAYVVVAENPTYLQAVYGAEAVGPFSGTLSNTGETITLRDATGAKADTVSYKAEFPWPVAPSGDGPSMELIHPDLDNDLGASWRSATASSGQPGTSTTLIPSQSTNWRYRIGSSEPSYWWNTSYYTEDSTWYDGAASFGFANPDNVTVLSDMPGTYTTFYLRKEFTVNNVSTLPTELTLNVFVDDGCIIWINGTEVARLHVTSGTKPYNSGCTKHNEEWETVAISSAPFVDGTNLIAVHAINESLNSSDMSMDLELLASEQCDVTPGIQNQQFNTNAPPAIRQVKHTPQQPIPGETVLITAKVTDSNGVASVTAHIQEVAPGVYIPILLPHEFNYLKSNPEAPLVENPDYSDPANWTAYAMADDGLNGDAVAGDSIFTLQLTTPTANRSLLRYRIEVEDSIGEAITVPYDDDDQSNFAMFCYAGVPAYETTALSIQSEGAGYIYPTNVMESLPVYHLISRKSDYDYCMAYDSNQIPQSSAARSTFNWPGTFVYDGIVYDNIRYRLRQNNERYSGRGKRSFRYRFNRGSYLIAKNEQGEEYPTRWRTLNTSKMTRFASSANFGLIETVNNRLWNMVGVPAPFTHYAHMRTVTGTDEAPTGTNGQYYGDFQGMTMCLEDYDSRFNNAHDIPDGNIYKLKDGVRDGAELKRNQGANSVTTDADWDEVYENLRPTQDVDYLDSHVNWDRWARYHVICEAVRHYDFDPADSWMKNRVWYFEPAEGSPYGLLCVLPHDSDAAWSEGYHEERVGVQNNSIGIDFPLQAIFGVFETNASGGTLPADKLQHRIEYRNMVRDIRDLLWQEETILTLIDYYADLIRDFQEADTDRWKDAPSDAGYEYFSPYTVDAQITKMEKIGFISDRANKEDPFVGGRASYLDLLANAEGDDGLIPDTPTLSYTGTTGYPVNKIIVQSSNFSDPQGGFGAIKWRVAEITDPTAPAYDPESETKYEYEAAWESDELTIEDPIKQIPASAMKVGRTYRARVKMMDDTGRWSHWSDPLEFTTGDADNAAALMDNLRITELMYHPQDDSLSEFVELYNNGTSTLDLNGITFTKGIEFAFPAGTTLEPSTTLLVVPETTWTNLPAFMAAYDIPSATSIYGPYTGKLSNSGEEVNLKTSSGGSEILSIDYSDGGDWPARADGKGSSIELINPGSESKDPTNWEASSDMNGTAGVYPPPPPSSYIVINEVLAHTDLPLTDSIELFNSGRSSIDISGWYLSDSSTFKKYQFPTGTVINAWAYLVVDETDFNPNGEWNTDPDKGVPATTDFALSSSTGETVYLTAADASDNLLFFADQVKFGGTFNGDSWGRYENGSGNFYTMTSRTLGTDNAEVRVGQVTISEIMYEHSDTNNAAVLEFVEIYNNGSVTEDLENWSVNGGIDYAFTTGAQLAPGETMVLVGFDPADPVALSTFQTTYGTTIIPNGPWDGRLNNLGETVRLRRPDTPPVDNPTLYPQTEEERVTYSSSSPWPLMANGMGEALQRARFDVYADTSENWISMPPTPGTQLANPLFEQWEEQYFSTVELNDPAVSGSDIDADNDGISNFDEYVADTNPRQEASAFYIAIDSLSSSEAIISFDSSSERKYSLHATSSLLDQNDWTPVFSNEPGTGAIMEWSPSLDQDKRFFKLEAIAE